MNKKLRLTAFLMVFAILACRIGIVNVNAAEGVKSENARTELSGLRITDLDKPVPGKTLDLKARVRTNENVTWEIPVIWIDDLGNTVYEAVPGRKYYPSFAFYVPAGYSINTKATGSQLGVRLPDFLVELFGSSVAFVGDAQNGITYITYVPAYIAEKGTDSSKTGQSAIAPAASVLPVNSAVTRVPAVDPYSDNRSSDDKDNKPSVGTVEKENSKPVDNQPSPANIVPYDPYKQVRIHCSKNVIRMMGESALNELVTIVKNKLEPQAVNLLKNSFKGFGKNTSSLGKEIGLFIYYEKDYIDKGDGTTDETMTDVLAFVSGGYLNDVKGDEVFKYIIGIDTSSFMEENPETGKWQIKESEKTSFDNTIVHEMMHAFMDDYTRRGMCDDKDKYPVWFMEGMASAVENVYQFRAYEFQTLGVLSGSNGSLYEFSENAHRYVPKDSGADYRIRYSDASIQSKYTDNTLRGKYRYDLMWSSDKDNTGSAYVSGYLAVVYLSYLTALHDGKTDVVTAPDYDNGQYPQIDIDALRYGTGRILDMLHEGHSLDSIISTVSSRPEGAGSYYTSTNDFQAKFIKDAAESDNIRKINTVGANKEIGTCNNVLGSLTFCNYYLNYLESTSKDGDETKLATGSILSADLYNNGQHLNSPLDWTKNENSDLYRIVDSQSYVASTVDDEEAWKETGGKSISHVNGENNDDSGQGMVAAAKPVDDINVNEGGSVPENTAPASDETASDEATPVTEVTTPAPVAENVETVVGAVEVIPPVAEPVTEPVAEPVTEPVAEPVAEPEVATADPAPEENYSESESCTIEPHDEDAIVPDYEEPVAEPVDEPDGDGGSDGSSDSSGGSEPEPESGSDEGPSEPTE